MDYRGRRLGIFARCGRSAVTLQNLVQLADKLDPRREQPLCQGIPRDPVRQIGVLVEELEIAAPVEDVEIFLVPPGSEQVRTQPRAAPDHLPELGLGTDDLEENE